MQSIEQRLLEGYLSNVDMIGEGLPVALNARRAEYLASFRLAGLPGPGDEAWRHTDVRKLFEGEWEQYFTLRRDLAARFPLEEPGGYRMRTVNGFAVDSSLTTLANGVVYGSLRAAAVEVEGIVAQYYGLAADSSADALTALSGAFMQDGLFIWVPDGVEAQEPFVIDDYYTTPEHAELCFARMLFVVSQGASAEVILTHRSQGEGRMLVNGVRESVAGEGGRLHLVESFDLAPRTAYIQSDSSLQAARSECTVVSADLGAGTLRRNVRSELAGREARFDLRSLMLCGEGEHSDLSVHVAHRVPDCNSFELAKGIACGNGTGVFTGRVHVAPDAQRTDARQQCRNLLLSDRAHIYAMPQLEIYADDVKCSHGATVGQINNGATFYMRQRGLDQATARRLQLTGFANDVLMHCRRAPMCRYMAERAEEKLETF